MDVVHRNTQAIPFELERNTAPKSVCWTLGRRGFFADTEASGLAASVSPWMSSGKGSAGRRQVDIQQGCLPWMVSPGSPEEIGQGLRAPWEEQE